MLVRIAPPRVRLLQVDATDPTFTRVTFEAERVGAQMQSTTVYLNGVPLTVYGERTLSSNERDRFARTIDVRPEQSGNVLRIEVDTGVSIGLQEVYMPGPATTVSRKAPGDLYVVAIGVSHLTKARRTLFPDLPFAARDAEELVGFLRKQAALAYQKRLCYRVGRR